MSAGTRRRLQGRIILVQEDRFRLLDDSGRGCLFTLSHKSGIDQWDLERLRDADARVEIEFDGEPNLDSGVAVWVQSA